MPWKMIGFIIFLVLVALFASLNLSNRSNIHLGFHVFEDVPIFLSLLLAFLAGAVLTIPFTLRASSRKRRARKERHEQGNKGKELAGEANTPGADPQIEETGATKS